MGKIDELIKELCPNGVLTYPLWSLTAWDKKFNAVDKSMQRKIIKYKYLLAKDLENLIEEDGDIRILYTTKDIAFTTEEKAGDFISEGEIVAIPWGGNVSVKYYKGKFVTGDNRIATSIDTSVLDNKYLFYWMENSIDVIESFYRGAGIKHPSMLSVLTLEIPLPPLSIQQQIVEILDTFTDSISNLQEELELREKQMEYYRENLLSFDGEEVEYVKLGGICEIKRGIRVIKKELSDSGVYPVFQNSLTPLGYYDKTNCAADKTFIIMAGAAGEIGYTDEPIWAADDCFYIDTKDTLYNKYTFYNLLNCQHYLKSKVRKASIPRLSRNFIEDLLIPLPPLSRQQEIVDILDTFESMIANIKQEIELRQKQYEYYREKLLNFERKKA